MRVLLAMFFSVTDTRPAVSETRAPSTVSADKAGFPFRQLAADEGVIFPDHFDHDWRAGSRQRVMNALTNLQAGVTELHVQPAVDTPEVRALTSHAEQWIDDHDFVTTDRSLPERITEVGATLIGYRELRSVMRDG